VLAVWLAYGRRAAVSYTLGLVAFGLVTAATFFAWFGDPMLFQLVTLVGHQPWYAPGAAGLAAQVWALLRNVWDLVAVLVLALAVAVVLARDPTPLGARAWIPPLLAALVLLPGGALGANKAGGDHNSFHSVYFIAATIAALLVGCGQPGRVARVLGHAACVAAIVAAWRSDLLPLAHPQPPIWQNDAQAAYEVSLRHPGEVYFPWQPLASLLAEGRVYHFDYALIDRILGGFPPTPAHLRADVPPHLRWIAARGRVYTFNLFPEFSEQVVLPELPGWTVRARGAS
jgi:hypothetical protein